MYTMNQAKSVSKMLMGRAVRVNSQRDALEVRGTSRMDNIDLMIADIDALAERLELTICYVDPAIYDATAR
jgi:hypothetical protein